MVDEGLYTKEEILDTTGVIYYVNLGNSTNKKTAQALSEEGIRAELEKTNLSVDAIMHDITSAAIAGVIVSYYESFMTYWAEVK